MHGSVAPVLDVPSATPGASSSSFTKQEPLIGVLPSSVYAQILSYLPVYDIPAVARTCKRLAKVVRCDDAVWRRRCELLRLEVKTKKDEVVEASETADARISSSTSRPTANTLIPTLPKPNKAQDDFGDFGGRFVIDDGDGDGFGDFEQAGQAGANGNGDGKGPGRPGVIPPIPKIIPKEPLRSKPSLLEMDFDLADVPLPSKMSLNGKGPKPSGFFALVAPPSRNPPSSREEPDKPMGRQSLSFARSSVDVIVASSPFYLAYREHHVVMWDYVQTLRSLSSAGSASGSNGTSTRQSSTSPSQLLSLLFPPSPTGPPALLTQSKILVQILRFLSKAIQPSKDWGWLRQVMGGCCDRFEGVCLMGFEKAEGRLVAIQEREARSGQGGGVTSGQAERGVMREAAESSWMLHLVREEEKEDESRSGGLFGGLRGNGRGTGRYDTWELGRVWVEKQEVFYEGSKWDPSENVVRVTGPEAEFGSHRLDFTPMDAFMGRVLAAILSDGGDAMEIFPARTARSVMLAYVDRLASDVLAEYINPLLNQTKLLSQKLFLTATAATFIQAWRVVDAVCKVLLKGDNGQVGSTSAITAEAEVGAIIFDMFDVNLDDYLEEEVENIKSSMDRICSAWDRALAGKDDRSGAQGTAFIASANPALVKKNVLAGFRDVLLLPVTVVPLTVNYGVSAITAGGTQVVNGLSMLNPQKWTNSGSAVKAVARADLEKEEKAGAEEWTPPVLDQPTALMAPSDPEKGWSDIPTNRTLLAASVPATPDPAATVREASKDAFDQLQLLLSLDVVLELIQADREALKRVETFRNYPGKRGEQVKHTIEEVFILLLQAIGNRHIVPGFKVAIAQMGTYEPGQDKETTSVAPLVQFFELVHIGDTIQSIVQTYFDKDMTPYVNRSDFINRTVQEKKRFEGTLDDSVAGGLNAGIEVLMNQVDHVIQTRTPPGAYCPPDTAEMELGPTRGCQDAIKCLQQHCELLKGSTSKDVLEVFYQEVGIRLQAILQRHIKRQIISQTGGFQVISDLNAYHQFIATLRQPRLTEDFSNLKMLGHVYIVADAKDLASIVRDVTRYGGTFTPEDLYEFIQRRSDWRKISKTVDQAMYALSVSEDCVIM